MTRPTPMPASPRLETRPGTRLETRPERRPGTPVRATLAEGALGLWDSYSISQRNVLELIPAEALHAPIVSGALASRFHMVMAPEAVRRVLQTRVDDYPKSDVARNVLRPAMS